MCCAHSLLKFKSSITASLYETNMRFPANTQTKTLKKAKIYLRIIHDMVYTYTYTRLACISDLFTSTIFDFPHQAKACNLTMYLVYSWNFHFALHIRKSSGNTFSIKWQRQRLIKTKIELEHKTGCEMNKV